MILNPQARCKPKLYLNPTPQALTFYVNQRKPSALTNPPKPFSCLGHREPDAQGVVFGRCGCLLALVVLGINHLTLRRRAEGLKGGLWGFRVLGGV